jgi:DNA-binding CsgD family transcriptional regulator
MLVGREVECLCVDRVLASARRGRSAVLLISGEAGVGKTSLLRYAIERAEAMNVVRATGVELEAELEFSGLLELCRPLLHHLDDLPELQARSLRGVLGLEEADVRDRFAVGVATLSLLAAAAEREPLVVVLDDLQWLDGPSADALRFAARRLFADRVAVIVATRIGEGVEPGWPGAEELVVAPLDVDESRMVLERAVGWALPDAVVAVLHAATGGNPLALVELPEVLTPDQLGGRMAIEEPLPVGAAVERAYAGRARFLPEATRLALLILALATLDQVDAVTRALAFGGLDPTSLEPAERARLINTDDGRVRFRHPLYRSALARAASPAARRAAHRALAQAFEAAKDTERQAWHLAGAVLGPDEEAAAALAAAGARARKRSGFGPAATALERAARLSPTEPGRLERLREAADNAWLAGATDRAVRLVDEALDGHPGEHLRARLLYLRGRLEVYGGSHERAREMMVEGGRLVEDVDPTLAALLIGSAVEPCWSLGRVADGIDAAERARELAAFDGSFVDAETEYWLGRALLAAGRPEEAAVAFEALRVRLGEVPDAPVSTWAVTEESVVLGMLDRSDEGFTAGFRAVEVARTAGPTSLLRALVQVSWNGVRAGSWRHATAAATEALALARELNQPIQVVDALCDLMRIEAARGERERCRAHAEDASALAERHGLVIVREQIRASLGLLELGLGRPEEALRYLDQAARNLGEIGFYDRDVTPEPDLVETLVRLGRAGDDGPGVRRSIERVERTGTAWGKPVAMRLRALVADDASFEDMFQGALELHRVVGDDRFALARTELAFGERLRRVGRRRQARDHLRQAIETFEDLPAEPWLERAAAELRATGETIRRRQPHEREELTPQELQIAILVAEGRTNKEVGAALYLSHKTVEFHLGRIYRKLNIGSRVELARHFAAAESSTVSVA